MPRSADRHEYFVHDGQTCIGRFVIDARAWEARAFAANRKALGKYPDLKAAFRAVSQAHMAAKGNRAGGASAQTSANATSEASRGAPAR
jgi:hypothetical protein